MSSILSESYQHLQSIVVQRDIRKFLSISTALCGCLLLKTLILKWTSLRRAFAALGDVPGRVIVWVHPFRSVAPVLAPFFPSANDIGDYYANYGAYAKYGSTIVGTVKFSGSIPTFWVSDGDALKVVQNNRTTFRRDLEGYNVVSVYGPSLVGTEGPEWKRHRAVSKPAFNEGNNTLVWLHSTRIVNEWFSALDSLGMGRKEIRIDLIKDFTEMALLILSSAAFGRHNSWGDHSVSEELASTGRVHDIPFRPAVTSAVNNLVPKVLLPNWLFTLAQHIPLPYVGPFLRDTANSFVALRLHMLDTILAARPWATGGDASSMEAALLMNLVRANIAQEDNSLEKRRLTDEELLSNTFMFLLAGHETSAHSLCFALCLLSLWPNVQEKMFKEVESLWPNGNPAADSADASAYQDIMNQLPYTMAVFREVLRLFPPVPRVASPVSVDTHLTGRRFTPSDEKPGVSNVSDFDVAIPAQSIVVIDIIALHRNPIHWGNDADEFRPERFIDTDTYKWPRQAFMAFSAGPRACMGERFAIIESVCTLANVVRKYKVSVPDELKSKSRKEQMKHLLAWVPRMTLIPSNAFVNVTQRN